MRLHEDLGLRLRDEQIYSEIRTWGWPEMALEGTAPAACEYGPGFFFFLCGSKAKQGRAAEKLSASNVCILNGDGITGGNPGRNGGNGAVECDRQNSSGRPRTWLDWHVDSKKVRRETGQS